MASNLAFVILLPNARRETVKATLDTSILQILEDTCNKRGYNANEWDLKHYNRIIELGHSVRFAGLPNNATLEMVQSAKPRVESPVTVVLQLDTGKRFPHQFYPTTSLWEVLQHWSNKGEQIINNTPGIEPVCVYMRQEINGQVKLQDKTLKSLGLFQGSAVIRLIHRPVNHVNQQANISGVLTRPPSKQLDDSPTASPHPIRTENIEMSEDKEAKKSPALISKPGENVMGSDNMQEVPDSTRNSEHERVQSVNENRTSQRSHTEASLSSNNTSNRTYSMPNSNISRERHAQPGELHAVAMNDAFLYHGDDVEIHEIESPPDDFYSVTIQDVKTMYRSLQNKRIQLEEAPFQTQSARELEHENNVQRILGTYPITIVRIRFPDRFVLQSTFSTNDSISVVYSFVQNLLEEPGLDFYLFTTPPRKVLSQSSTLVDEELVGFAVIYFGSNTQQNRYLKQTLQPSDPQRVFAVTPNPNSTANHSQPGRRVAPTPQQAGVSQGSHDGHAAPNSNFRPSNNPGAGTSALTSNRNTDRTVNSNVVPKWFRK